MCLHVARAINKIQSGIIMERLCRGVAVRNRNEQRPRTKPCFKKVDADCPVVSFYVFMCRTVLHWKQLTAHVVVKISLIQAISCAREREK